jgi:hypothetical protein
MWIDPPNASGDVRVHLWDYKHRRLEYVTAVTTLEDSLDEAYAMALTWVGTPG